MQNEELLTDAIVEQAADDYRKAFMGYQVESTRPADYTMSELDKFFHSEWYRQLTNINGDWLMQKIRIDELENLLSLYKRFIGSIYEKSITLTFREKVRESKKVKPVKADISPLFIEDFMNVLRTQEKVLEEMIKKEKEQGGDCM